VSALTSAGGGIYCVSGASPTITNCTISGNESETDGGGFLIYGASATLTNTLLWGDAAGTGPELWLDGSSTVTVSYSDVQSGEPGAYVAPGSTLNWGSGNLTTTPSFVDPDGADDIPGTPDDDYRLMAISPCIDSGDNAAPGLPSTDPDGNPRVVDGDNDSVAVVDMGAYEFQPEDAWGASSTVAPDGFHVQSLQRSHAVSFLIALLLPFGVTLLMKRRPGRRRIRGWGC